MTAPLLSVRDLRVSFQAERGVAKAVDGVSFDVASGETLGIVGESGCGKTVTALSILGLLPTPPARVGEGSSIRFMEEELVGAPEDRLRRIRGNEISMVFQEPMTSLNPVLTVGEQIVEALRHHRGMSRLDARTEAARLLSEVGIPAADERLNAYPHQLSGGMRQRVMIAIALSCEPKLVLADEPSTALDVTIQAQILELIASLKKSRNMAVVLITHDLGVVAEVCERVVVMYAGQVVETGRVETIFSDPRHPYTRGLLDSLPVLGETERRLKPIPGSVPSPIDRPHGCRFRDRCTFAEERCGEEQPLVELDGSGRTSRCWRSTAPSWATAGGGAS